MDNEYSPHLLIGPERDMEEMRVRFEGLQKLVCELLIKNQRLRLELTSAPIATRAGKHR